MDRPIEFFNRYSGQVETEAVYGERWLRWAYGKPLGRLATWALVRRAWFSRLYGRLMDRPTSLAKVAPFMRRFGLEPDEILDAHCHTCFNDFFSRRLVEGRRPVDAAPDAVVFPADARHLGFQDFAAADGVVVKGEKFDLAELLGSWELAERFSGGALVISRLCPTDYHRFHFPLPGIPGDTQLIPGPLDSVSPIALRRRIRILSTNKRTLTLLQDTLAGTVLLIEVGAACVGTIVQSYLPGRRVGKGDEKGYFKFGGSTTITIFEPGRVRLAKDLVENTAQRRELYARMGDRMGEVSTHSAQ